MVKLDKVDKQIISILRKNGRRSYKKIGDDIGYSLMGTKRRLLKLVEEDLIKITATENINKLGYKLALTLLEVESQTKLNSILERFKECPRAVFVFTMMSGYNLAVITVAEDQNTLESEAWEKCSWRNQPGVRRSEFYPIEETHYSPFLPVREELMQGEASKAPCGVICGECDRYKAGKCLGCPATKYYKK